MRLLAAYNHDSQERLKEKIDYEIQLLDFLSKTQETFEGGTDISTITLTNRRPGAQVAIGLTEVLGSGEAIKVIDAMSPLTFTASQWILEENAYTGNIQMVPWKFSVSNNKLRIVANVDGQYFTLVLDRGELGGLCENCCSCGESPYRCFVIWTLGRTTV